VLAAAKYSHAAVWAISQSMSYHRANVTTPGANLAKLTRERPALIRHDDGRQAHESGLNNLTFSASALQGRWRPWYVTDPEKPCADFSNSLLYHPVIHITISGFHCSGKSYRFLNDRAVPLREISEGTWTLLLSVRTLRTFREALVMWQGTTHHTWSCIESHCILLL
jgi:hypothetical protein